MRGEVRSAPARERRHDVEVRSVRRDEERGSRVRDTPVETGAGKGPSNERMRDVVQGRYYRRMRCRAGIAALALGVLLATPTGVRTWSFDAHRFITARAIDRLPSELKPFFDRGRPFVVEHSVDPDLWRLAGWDQEPPRHFLDLDAYGSAPFAELPRDYDRAIQRYGADRLRQHGLLPWRTAEIYDRLR